MMLHDVSRVLLFNAALILAFSTAFVASSRTFVFENATHPDHSQFVHIEPFTASYEGNNFAAVCSPCNRAPALCPRPPRPRRRPPRAHPF